MRNCAAFATLGLQLWSQSYFRCHREQDSVAQAKAAFAKWHQVDLEQGRCIVFRFPDRDKELVLVPVRIKTGIETRTSIAAFQQVRLG